MNDLGEDWLDDAEASWTRDRSRHFEERSFRAFPEVKVHGWRSNDGRMRLSVEGPSADRVLDGVTIAEAEALREALDKALEHAKKRGAL